MGDVQATSLNTDTDGKRTSSEYGDRGDGTLRWYQWRRTANGGDATQGATSDAAVTDPTAAATVVGALKGILTRLANSATGLLKSEDAAHATGDAGVMVLAVRRDTAAASSGTTGDYEPLQTDATGRLRTYNDSIGYPSGATPLIADSGIVSNASAAATLAGAASQTTYIAGFEITAGGATAGALVEVTVAGILGGTLSYAFATPTGAAVGATPLTVTFDPPLPASAANTSIVVTCPALGAGNTHAAAVAHGFRV